MNWSISIDSLNIYLDKSFKCGTVVIDWTKNGVWSLVGSLNHFSCLPSLSLLTLLPILLGFVVLSYHVFTVGFILNMNPMPTAQLTPEEEWDIIRKDNRRRPGSNIVWGSVFTGLEGPIIRVFIYDLDDPVGNNLIRIARRRDSSGIRSIRINGQLYRGIITRELQNTSGIGKRNFRVHANRFAALKITHRVRSKEEYLYLGNDNVLRVNHHAWEL